MKTNPFYERERKLDAARDAFTRAAAALTSGNRLHDRSYFASALLESCYGVMQLAQADTDLQGHDEAVAYLKALHKELP